MNSSSVIIEVKNSLYQTAVLSSDNMWAATKKGAWGRGLINSKTDPKRAQRLGRICEMAFSIYTGLPITAQYIQGGDRGDFIIGGKVVDVKKSYCKQRQFLVQAYTDRGHYSFKEYIDIYVGVSLLKEDAEKNFALTRIDGYMHRDDLKNYPIQMSPLRHRRHKNYVVPLDDLLPISDLKKML